MADLSNLLGDVYGDPTDGPAEDGAPTPSPAPVPPAWADESRLDEAFADWTPEPLEAVVATAPVTAPVPSTTSAPLDDDLAAALSAALADAPRPTMPSVERFAHVDADQPLEPPVVDAATLEPVPVVDVDAIEQAFVPPTPVAEPEPAPVEGKRRSFSLARRPKPPVAAPAVAVGGDADVVVATAEPGRGWQRTDDDILPAGAGGRRGGFRLR